MLSVVIVSYNMRRELSRTLRSLSPSMQKGIAADEYEVIVVDNGSTEPFDELECRRLLPDLTIHRMQRATASPVPAINKGLELARGDLVGVWIDGARMASPGLLDSACRAARLAERPVVGTLAFHLGPEVQMRSVLEGYNQRVEDELLVKSGWEADGYRLFNIAVFAGSSAQGWFVVPYETNAIFLHASHWQALGGYDANFKTPGGGLANLDLWARLCADPAAYVVMLLGEATFHQVHGGIATNARDVGLMPTFRQEYLRVRGEPYQPPTLRPHFFGQLNPYALPSMLQSLQAPILAAKS